MDATPLTFSMEDTHCFNSVCLRYVNDKKLSVFQSNVNGNIFKTQNYSTSIRNAAKVFPDHHFWTGSLGKWSTVLSGVSSQF